MLRRLAVLSSSGVVVAAAFCVLACGHATTQPRTRTTSWRLFHVSRDGRTLFVDYAYGCPYRSMRVTAAETATTVTVTVLLKQYLFGNYVCLAVLQNDTARVDLNAPLGRRRLIDGSNHNAPEVEPPACQLVAQDLRDSMRRLGRPARSFAVLDRLNRFCRT